MNPLSRNQWAVVYLASATRNATTSGNYIQAVPGCALWVELDCTAYAGTCLLKTTIEGWIDPSGANNQYWFQDTAGLAIQAKKILVVSPRATQSLTPGNATATIFGNGVIPPTFRITIVHTTADNETYQVRYMWVPES